ncbi:protein tincar [Stomoxys calcitrans]|uniref:protein tincar n=1 Tax=Stomoxys calcitrans TaxID=35570 RepID=UPI0027E3092E|nr:protein tincar [Stomoxys calcitrans]
MSMKGSLLTFENNNDIVSKSKKRSSALHSAHFNTSTTSTTTYASMGKTASPSLNSSISNSVITSGSGSGCGSGGSSSNHLHPSHTNFPSSHLPAKYMNSKRKHAKYNNMYSNMYPDHNNYLHLNSLWSIWYGVLLTLFQGYLAVHGAYRFLGCSLISWKIEPVAELNLQIILSGLVFILLPFFFTSAVFKVGNMANDGVKLATSIKEQRCSMSPHDGLEEESRGGTLRALWTHGGPTAAFIHIVIAMCLLLPRLLLEARIIENGLLPRETIWQTELDFMNVNRRHLVVLSVMASPYQNDTSTYESQEDEEYLNDTIFSSYSSESGGSASDNVAATMGSGGANSNSIRNSLWDVNSRPHHGSKWNNVMMPAVGKSRFLELPDLIDAVENQSSKYNKFHGKAHEAKITPPTAAKQRTTTTSTTEATTMAAHTTTIMPATNAIEQEKNNRDNDSGKEAKGNAWITIEEDRTMDSTSVTQPVTTLPMSTTPNGMINSKTTTTKTTTTTTTTTPLLSTTPTKYSTRSKLSISGNNNMAIDDGGPTFGGGGGATKPTFSTSAATLAMSSSTSHRPTPPSFIEEQQKISSGISKKHQHHHHNNGKTSRRHNGHHRQRKLSTSAGSQSQRKHHQHLGNRRTEEFGSPNVSEVPEDVPLKANRLDEFEYPPSGRVYEHRPSSYEELDFGRARAAIYPKSSTTISTTTRDSNIHIVKPEKLPEIVPSTPVSSNSKIIEIKAKTKRFGERIKRQITFAEENQVEIEPEYLVGDLNFNDSSEYLAEMTTIDSSTATTTTVEVRPEGGGDHLDGFAGMLQLFFGIEKAIDVATFTQPPSAEFVNLVIALLVWCVRYPAVFWSTAKSFATIFSVQMIATASDIIFSFAGISNLFKLQIYSEAQPVQNPGLILNATVTLALFLLSTVLMLSSSMIMYLYGHGRLAAKMRDRSIITLKSGQSWIYFAHCASLCYILALCVVKAPLLNDLSATYRHNLHCPTFMAALVSVMHILLWIVIWLCLTIKRRWSFKLPPLDAYAIISKATTQPLLMHNRGSLTNTTTASLNNSTNLGGGNSSSIAGDSSGEHKPIGDQGGNQLTNAPSTDPLAGVPVEDVYWPKLTPSSPKLKVTFNEVTSTCDDDHNRRLIGGDHQQNDGKRNSPRGTALCFTSITGEIDDGEYATLRSATSVSVVGIAVGGAIGSSNSSKGHPPTGGVSVLRLSEYEELPPPPQHLISSSMSTGNRTIATRDYVNCSSNHSGTGVLGDDNISEEGKLLACVRDDSVTYASTRDLEPPLPPPPPPTTSVAERAPHAIPDIMQLSSSPEHLVSPLAPVTVTVHTNEAHITSSSTPRCLRRADSGVPQEALTPRSDTTSMGTESTTSPPERAPSESSSGVHSAEERDVEVVIRPRAICKPPAKPPQPAIQEEPYGRCTNMRMSSFACGVNSNSATLPPQRSQPEQKFDYSQHCSTMPLPSNAHFNQPQTQQAQSAVYATSAHCMTQSLNAATNMSSFKTPLYANSGVALSGNNNNTPTHQHNQTPPQPPPYPTPHPTHTTLPNGVRYSNPNILRRLPYVKGAESPYGHLGLGAGHHAFTKTGYENTLLNSTIPEDRDSANYSMTSDQDCLYATANPLH